MLTQLCRMSTFEPPVYQRIFYLIALASLICLILVVGAGFLVPFTIGAFFSMLLVPLARWLERRRAGKFMSAMLPVILLIVGILFFVALATGQIASIAGSLEGANERVAEYIGRIDRYLSWQLHLEKSIFPEFDQERLIDFLKGNGMLLLKFMSGLAGSMVGMVLVPVFVFFFLYYRQHLSDSMIRVFRHHPQATVERHAEALRVVAEDYLVGLIKVVAILAVLYSVGLSLIGVKHAIFFGVFAGMLNLVPYLGPVLGSVLPTLFVLATEDSIYYPVAVLAFFGLVQILEGNVLTPKIVGNNVRLNPFVTFAGLLIGGIVWGIIGMIIVIPIISIGMKLLKLSPRTEPYAFLLSAPK